MLEIADLNLEFERRRYERPHPKTNVAENCFPVNS